MAKNSEVFVDLYPWIKFTSENPLSPRVPMNGVFRHAVALCKYFTPALANYPYDDLDKTALKRVEGFIGKPVKVINNDSSSGFLYDSVRYVGCKCWVSIAPDCSGPAALIPSKNRKYKTLAILHDTFSAQGDYLEQNQRNYEGAVTHTDAFAYVSKTAKETFRQYVSQNNLECKAQFIPYGAPHRYDVPPSHLGGKHTLSLSTVGKNKNLSGLSKMADYFDTRHYHIGKFADISEEEAVFAAKSYCLNFTGELSDRMIDGFMSQSSAFFCLSYKEGFSMPPMEAIIAGVRRMVLSDIPVHQEIYGILPEIVFVDPSNPLRHLEEKGYKWIADLPEIDFRWREYFFKKYEPAFLFRHILDYIKAI